MLHKKNNDEWYAENPKYKKPSTTPQQSDALSKTKSPVAQQAQKARQQLSVNEPIVRSDAPTTSKKKKKKVGSVVNEATLEKIKQLRKKWGYKDKPAPTEDGFPEQPPAKLDPQTGFHPEYGKKAKRYGKLDPHSAESMPKTGDPEIDSTVEKQKNHKEKARKIKNLVGKLKG